MLNARRTSRSDALKYVYYVCFVACFVFAQVNSDGTPKQFAAVILPDCSIKPDPAKTPVSFATSELSTLLCRYAQILDHNRAYILQSHTQVCFKHLSHCHAYFLQLQRAYEIVFITQVFVSSAELVSAYDATASYC
jgi:hypothetical protein